MTKTHVDIDGMRKAAVKEALDAAEERHVKELRAAMSRAKQQAKQDKDRALARQRVVSTAHYAARTSYWLFLSYLIIKLT